MDIFFIYLFFHSIIDRAGEIGQVDQKERKRLDSESEKLKSRKTISVPSEIENVEWKAFDPEMVRRLTRKTSSEDFIIYSMFTFTSRLLAVVHITLPIPHTHRVDILRTKKS